MVAFRVAIAGFGGMLTVAGDGIFSRSRVHPFRTCQQKQTSGLRTPPHEHAAHGKYTPHAAEKRHGEMKATGEKEFGQDRGRRTSLRVAGATWTMSTRWRSSPPWCSCRKGCCSSFTAVGLSAGSRRSMSSTKPQSSGEKFSGDRAGTGSAVIAWIIANICSELVQLVDSGKCPRASAAITCVCSVERPAGEQMASSVNEPV